MLSNAIKLALQQIRRNIMRSFLTTLGIIIGVAAVITMVALGNGATAQVTDSISALGSNLMMLNRGQGFGPGRSRQSGPAFELDDIEAIKAEIAGIKAISPVSSGSVTLVNGNNSWNSNVRGTDNAFLIAANWTLASGREFNAEEEAVGSPVCIIGQTIIREVFPGEDAVNKKMRINGFSCTVIATLKGKGQTSFGSDQDDIVIIPLPTFQRRVAGNRDVGQIYISLQDNIDSGHVEDRLTSLMRMRRNISPSETDDFNIFNTTEIAETLTSTTKTMTGLLGAVAGVSLLVGGIGIMNIMLVSVTERTREIGIRLAIGALEHEVLLQFLVEAVVLSALGGLVGIILAFVLSYLMAMLMHMPFIFDYSISVAAFIFSAAVGVVFGFVPARRAARLNPIEALRHE